MTEQEFAQVARERLIDATEAAKVGGYAFRQGFWRAVHRETMPQPVLTFGNLSLWDICEVERWRTEKLEGEPA